MGKIQISASKLGFKKRKGMNLNDVIDLIIRNHKYKRIMEGISIRRMAALKRRINS